MKIDLGKIVLIQKYKDGKKVVMSERGDITLDDLIDTFEHFLKGCGYQIPDGYHLDLVNFDAECEENIEEEYGYGAFGEPQPTIRMSIDDATEEEWNEAHRKLNQGF